MKYTKVFNNSMWIILCKVFQSLLQLVIGMLCARYLGPSNYGLINYAASVVAFAVPIMKLGLDATLVYEFVNAPEKEGEIMGTALVMNILSSIACILGVSAFVTVANFGDTVTIVVCVLYSISILFSSLDMMQYWFQYKLMSKYSSIIMLVAYVIVALYRIFLLMTSKSVYWFAFTKSIDYAFVGVALIAVYFKKSKQGLSFCLERAKKLLSKSKHYIIAALMLVVIQNTDHIMLTKMVSAEHNGYYSAAITSATVVQFVYIAIIDSFRPLILSSKKEDAAAYEKNISRLYGIAIYLSLAQSVFFTVFANLIIHLLYGSAYSPAVSVLRILTWYIAFSYMGTVRDIWLLAEEKQKYLPILNLSGAIFNIVLNAVLIPFYSACGAAFASLLTQIFTNFILGFILKPLRKNNRLLLKGINPKFFIHEIREIVDDLRRK